MIRVNTVLRTLSKSWCNGRGPALSVFLAFLLVCAASQGNGQDSAYVAVQGSDGEGHTLAITLGVHTRATNSFNWQLGERPIPPVPAAPVFDVRFVDVTRRRTDYPGLDSYIDLRPYTARSQADTFYVRFQPANTSYPMHFSWSHDVGTRFQQAMLVYRKGSEVLTVNMANQDTLTLGEAADPINTLVIVTRGPKVQAKSH